MTKYLNEALNEAKWQSCNGSFKLHHAEEISELSGLSLLQTYKALDNFDYNIGGPVEWESKGKKDLIFKNTDLKKAWSWDFDEDEWTEIKYK